MEQYAAITTASGIGSESNGLKRIANEQWTLTLEATERPKDDLMS